MKNGLQNFKFNRVESIANQGKIENIEKAVIKELEAINVRERVKPNSKIGITAGSRGIANIPEITKSVVDYIKLCGGTPYIIPSMGSHGGATIEGQLKMLSNLGIDEHSMGCEFLASMDVVNLGTTSSGYTAYTDKLASELDGIFVINRVKPHTDFDSDIESGIVKMVAIGLGNQIGCNHIHSLGLKVGVQEVGEFLLNKLNIVGGLGIVENSHDETFLIKGVLKDDFIEEDKKMLILSKKLVPKLPIKDIDVLIVKKIGKTYSGTGMDTKVLGRIRIDGTTEPVYPYIKMVVALDLSEESDGNALGVGLADIITKDFYRKIDLKKTYANVVSTTYLERGKIPVTLDTDEDAIEAALSCIGTKNDEDKIIVIIENTLDLTKMLITTNINEEKYKDDYKIIESDLIIGFDENGKLSFDI